MEQQKCDCSLPPLKSQLVLEETSLPSYSQVTTEEMDSENHSANVTRPI